MRRLWSKRVAGRVWTAAAQREANLPLADPQSPDTTPLGEGAWRKLRVGAQPRLLAGGIERGGHAGEAYVHEHVKPAPAC